MGRVTDGVDIDERIGRHPAHQAPLPRGQGPGRQRPQGRLLGAGEPVGRPLVRRPMVTLIGLEDPGGQVRLERGEGREGPAGQAIVLDVADARLDFALGACPVGGARPRLDVPVAAEGEEARVKDDRAGRAVPGEDQRAGVIDEQRPWEPAKVPEGGGDPLAPVVLPLGQEGAHEEAARAAQHGRQQVDPHALAADLDPLLAEIDLHLRAGGRLEAHRRQRGHALLAPAGGHGPLHGPGAHVHVLIGQEPPHDDRVARRRRVKQPYRLGPRVGIEPPAPRPHLPVGLDAAPQVAPDRVARDPERPGDPLGTQPRAPSVRTCRTTSGSIISPPVSGGATVPR